MKKFISVLVAILMATFIVASASVSIALTAEGIKEGYYTTTGDVGDPEKAVEYGPIASMSIK